MKRTDITEIFPDATAEQLDKIMSLNGADINGLKAQLATVTGNLNAAQAQLAAAPAGTADELEKTKADLVKLQKQLDDMTAAENVRQIREKVSAEHKVPASLLTGDTEEACATQAKAILDFAASAGYPAVSDGGEPNPNGGSNSAWTALASKI